MLARTSMDSPQRDHWTITHELRKATCEEVGCRDYQFGWRIRVDALAEKDLHAMRESKRRYREVNIAEGETWWVFEGGQPCFRAALHKLPVDRPELYLVGGRGDVQRYDRADQWVDDLHDRTSKIVDKIQEG